MPRKYRTTRRKKRRFFGEAVSRSYRGSRYAKTGLGSGFPRERTVKLRYCTAVQLQDTVGGVIDNHIFRANSIFDPDYTGTGHQPLGTDQWLGFYNHYRVTSSRISVDVANNTQQATTPAAVFGIYVSDDLTLPTDWGTLAEGGRGPYQLRQNLNTETKSLSTGYNQSHFFKGQGVNQSQLGASAGANPTEMAYFVIYGQSSDKQSTMAKTDLMVTIEYTVKFSEPKDLAQS